MPNADGHTPGDNGGADNTAGQGGNDDASRNASGNGNGGKDGTGKDGKGSGNDKSGGGDAAGKIVFESQADLDALIQRRIARATKKLEDDAKLTAEEKLQKERDEALALVRERDMRDEFVAKADVSPAVAQRIFKAYRDEIEVNDVGKATNLDEILKMAKKEMPQVFAKHSGIKPGGGDGGSGTGGDGTTGGDMNSALRRMAGRGNQ